MGDKNLPTLAEIAKHTTHTEPPGIVEVALADRREWIIKGMGRCVVFIEQCDLPENVGGMLITSHDRDLDYFRLHILISSGLCNKPDFNIRVEQKITAVHEFTHVLAALSAISRVRADFLIMRLKEQFRKKAHAIYSEDIKRVATELNASLFAKFDDLGRQDRKNHFPDEHFRLGIEDFPVSYPLIFEEFLLSKEMFDEYFSACDSQDLI